MALGRACQTHSQRLLVVYLSAGLGFPKREVYRATTSYASLTDELRSRVSGRAFALIGRTDDRAEVRGFEAWVGAGCVDGADAVGYAAEESRCTLEGAT